MRSTKEEFPNPVLAEGRDDYNDSCSFRAVVHEDSITVDDKNIVIPVSYELQCNGLQKEIESKKAVVIVKVRSSEASYSEIFRFSDKSTELKIQIPKYSVVKKIELEGAIIAASDIHHFSGEGEFNDLYFRGSVFEIRKGDLLALGENTVIYVDDSELEKPLASVFMITRNDEQNSDVIPSFYGDKIEIYLKSDLYNLYYRFKDFNNGSLRRYATGIIVYPVLVEAVNCIIGYYQNEYENSADDFSSYRWFRAIELKAKAKGIDLANYEGTATTLANDLLGSISLDALKRFQETLESEMNSGETQMIGGVD